MAKSDMLSVRLFDVFDIDGNGEIDLKEFTVGLVCLVTGSKRDKLKSLFQVCVVRRDGLSCERKLSAFVCTTTDLRCRRVR